MSKSSQVVLLFSFGLLLTLIARVEVARAQQVPSEPVPTPASPVASDVERSKDEPASQEQTDVPAESDWVGDDFGAWEAEEGFDETIVEDPPEVEVRDANSPPRSRRDQKRRRRRREPEPAYEGLPRKGAVLLDITVDLKTAGGEVSDRGQSAELNDQFEMALSPSVGYFATDNWLLEAGLLMRTSTESSNGSRATADGSAFGGQAKAGYLSFVENGPGLFFFGDGALAFARGTLRETDADGARFPLIDSSSTELSTTLGLGIAFRSVLVKTGIVYGVNWTTLEDNTGSLDFRTSGFSVATSLGYAIQ